MTGPFSGQNPYGSPQGDQPPWEGSPGEQFPTVGYGGLYGGEPTPPPRKKRTGLIVLTIVLAVLVAGGTAGAVWWFNTDNNSGTTAAPPSRSTPTSSAQERSTAAAYNVGTCLIEANQAGSTASTPSLVLRPVQCGGDQAVLVINNVVPNSQACTAAADFPHHGYVLDDADAHVSYCLSLVVPVNQCFEFSDDNKTPIERVPCGSTPNTVQVLSVESAPNASSACTDKTNPDIWFYQSATSGQFACVSQPVSTGSSTPNTAGSAPNSPE